MNRKIPVIAAAVLVLAGCAADSPATGEWAGAVYDSAGVTIVANPPTGLWTPSTVWRLEEDLRIGVATGDPARQFGSVDGIAVDDVGRIYVLDGLAREIRVFDSAGGYVRTIGRQGGGPGELSSPATVLLDAGDTLVVPDTENGRVQRYLADGSNAGSFPLSLEGGIPLEWRIRPDGRLLELVRTLPTSRAQEGGGRMLVLLRSRDGAVRDTLVEMPAGEAMKIRNGRPRMTVFGAVPMWAQLVDGRIATGRNSEYRLEIRTPDGRLERVVRKPFERLPFGDDERRTLEALLRDWFEETRPSRATGRLIESMSYSDYYPVFAELFGGPHGTLWVRHALTLESIDAEDMADFDVRAFGGRVYDVFDRDGRFLGTITTPEGFQPMHAKGDHIYGVQGGDLGVQYVVRLRVSA